MTNRMKLLAAVAAIALPAAMAGAQSTAPGGGAHRPGTARAATPPAHAPAAQTPVTPTTNTATEDAQATTAQAAETPAAVNRNAEPGTQAEVATQTTTRAQTPPATPPAPAARAQAATQAQTQSPATQQPAPAAQAQAATQATATAPVATAEPVRAATATDLHAGVQVRDQAGGVVGTVESADASGAVVSTGTIRARLPLASFGASGQGLVISMTRGQLEAAATQARTQPSAG